MKTPPDNQDDRRHSERHATLKWAQIVFPDNLTCTTCTVLNQSPNGALLQIDPIEELPREFWLLDDHGAKPTPCSVRWRIGGQIGVMFTPALSSDATNGHWHFARGDARRPREIRSPFLRHPLMIS